jgi:NAD(P)H-dependent FMN reductase
MPSTPSILLVSGSLREGSTNTAALRSIVGTESLRTALHDGTRSLPHFDPGHDRDPLPPPVVDLRAQLGAVDAVLFCTPEYAGTLPGSFKNLLDWAVGGGELYEKPVGWINVSAHGSGTGATGTLGVVLGYCGCRIVEDACAQVPVARSDVGDNGEVADPDLVARLRDVALRLAAGTSAAPGSV